MTRPMLSLQPAEVTPELALLFPPNDPTGHRRLAVLDGCGVGRILTDSAEHPTWAVVQESSDGLLFLGGAIDSPLLREIITVLRADSDVLIGLWPEDPRRSLLPGNPDFAGTTFDFPLRHRYRNLTNLIRQPLPNGLLLQPLDLTLLARCAWREHQTARCGSIEAFFTLHGLGYCISQDSEIVSEAYAGPPVRGVMEIGIHTHPAHRRHGYAEIACAQLITTCEAQGYRTFWNCGATNVASATLARKLGFYGEQEYALVAWFKTATQEQAPTGV